MTKRILLTILVAFMICLFVSCLLVYFDVTFIVFCAVLLIYVSWLIVDNILP